MAVERGSHCTPVPHLRGIRPGKRLPHKRCKSVRLTAHSLIHTRKNCPRSRLERRISTTHDLDLDLSSIGRTRRRTEATALRPSLLQSVSMQSYRVERSLRSRIHNSRKLYAPARAHHRYQIIDIQVGPHLVYI